MRFPWTLLLLMCLTGPAVVSGAVSVEKKRAELKHLQGRIGALQKDLSKKEASKAGTAKALRDIESSIAATSRTLDDLGKKRSAAQRQLTDLERQSKTLSAQTEGQKTQLSGLLYQQFTHGGDDALRLLLSGEDPNRTARDRYFFTLLSQRKAELLEHMRSTLLEKQRLAEAVRGKGAELAAIEKQQQAERAALVAKQKDRQALLAQISRQIESQKRQISTLQGNEKRLGALISKLKRRPAPKKRKPGAAAPVSPRSTAAIHGGPDLSRVTGEFAALRGRLRLPVQGSIGARFGAPRGGNATTWKGIVIRAAEGSEVHAVAAGTVVYADWLRGFGNLLIVDHGDDFLSVYGNNQALLRQTGSDVKAGDTIARTGAGSGDEESGLYFELRHQGRPLDPLSWISR